MGKKASEKLPLKETISVTNTEGGEPQIVVERSRGFMRDRIVRKFQKQRSNGPWKQDGRAELMALADISRTHLDAAGLPTDKWPVQPLDQDASYDPNDHGAPEDGDLWLDYLLEGTRPLTEDQVAGNLLHSINRLLRDLTDDQLSEVFRAMQLYHLKELIGDLNQMAALGTRAKAGRTNGPKAKKARGDRTREIVELAAESFWSENPTFRKKRDMTAKKIFDDVNAARKEEDLGKPLGVKAIYNYVLEASREK